MITSTAVGNKCTRPSTFIDFTKDLTIEFWGAAPAASVAMYTTIWMYGDPSFSTPFIWVGTDNNDGRMYCDIFDGVTTTELTITLVPSTNKFFAIRYNSTTHQVDFRYNDTDATPATVNLGAIVFTTAIETILNDGGATSQANTTIGYLRIFQFRLTTVELAQEKTSIAAVTHASALLSDCPMQTSIDLTAHNNTETQFSPTGTVTTNLTDPLLSVITGPPTNTTPETAISVNTVSAIFQDLSSGGFSQTPVWYKWVAPDRYVYSVGTLNGADPTRSNGGLYHPLVDVFDSIIQANSGNFQLYFTFKNGSVRMQFPTYQGRTYYFKIHGTSGKPTSTLQFSLLRALQIPRPPENSFVILDDTLSVYNRLEDDGSVTFSLEEHFPGAMLNASTGYPIFFHMDTRNTELAAKLASGYMMVGHDDENVTSDGVSIYDNAYHEVATFLDDFDTGDQPGGMASNGYDTFVLGFFGNDPTGHGPEPPTLRVVRAMGLGGMPPFVLDPIVYATHVTTGANVGNFWSIGLDATATRVYYTNSGSGFDNTQVHVFNLETQSNEPEIVPDLTPPWNWSKGEILVLDNGNLAMHINNGDNGYLRIYTPTGTLVNQFFMGASGAADTRIAPIFGDINNILLWARTKRDGLVGTGAPGYSVFAKVDVNTGAVVPLAPSVPQFEHGITFEAPNNTPAPFGHSESCPTFLSPPVKLVAPPPPVIIQSDVPTCCDNTAAPPTTGTTPTAQGPVPEVVVPFWIAACEGGGNVPSAPPLTASENWDYGF